MKKGSIAPNCGVILTGMDERREKFFNRFHLHRPQLHPDRSIELHAMKPPSLKRESIKTIVLVISLQTIKGVVGGIALASGMNPSIEHIVIDPPLDFTSAVGAIYILRHHLHYWYHRLEG